MGKSRVMGAGFAGSNNVNAKSGGGSKKQGLVSTTAFGNRNVRHVRTKGLGVTPDRFKIYFVNQLSGVGRGHSTFNVPGSFTNIHGSFGPR
jgi:hypothetical protein